MAKAGSVKWTREHYLIALNVYRKLPFGKLHKTNSMIVEIAKRMGRSPSSLAMKLCNFASLDPVQRARGIKGLGGATPRDREMWAEFQRDLVDLAPQSEQLLHDMFTTDQRQEVDLLRGDGIRLERGSSPGTPTGPTEGVATVKTRRGQQFLRQTVLASYGVRCCVSGIPVPELLVASHILPWRDFPSERLNPRNVLCLSSIHDRAFDEGLITFDDQLRLVVGSAIRGRLPQPALQQAFIDLEGRPLRLPEKVAEPDPAFLARHRKTLYKG